MIVLINHINYLNSRKYHFWVFIIIIIIFQSINSFAQNTFQQDTIIVDSTQAKRLDLFNKENKHTFKILFSGKPARAGLFSLILPGAGQAYNKKYLYLPIIWGLLGGSGYLAIKSTQRYNEIDRKYKLLFKGESSIVFEGISYSNYSNLRPLKDKLQLSKERKWVTFGVIYFVQVVHAYIQRHLIDFDLNENLSITPSFIQGNPQFGITMNLNSKRKK